MERNRADGEIDDVFRHTCALTLRMNGKAYNKISVSCRFLHCIELLFGEMEIFAS